MYLQFAYNSPKEIYLASINIFQLSNNKTAL